MPSLRGIRPQVLSYFEAAHQTKTTKWTTEPIRTRMQGKMNYRAVTIERLRLQSCHNRELEQWNANNHKWTQCTAGTLARVILLLCKIFLLLHHCVLLCSNSLLNPCSWCFDSMLQRLLPSTATLSFCFLKQHNRRNESKKSERCVFVSKEETELYRRDCNRTVKALMTSRRAKELISKWAVTLEAPIYTLECGMTKSGL